MPGPDRVEIKADPPVPPVQTPPEGTVSQHGGTARVELAPKDPPPAKKPDETPARPEWLPEKFKSPEDLAKAYKELESKQGKKPEAPPPAGLSDADASKAVKDAGLDMGKLADEYAKSGTLSPESYKALEAKGITKDAVDGYIEGQKALGEKYTTELATQVGGPEALDSLLKWAGANLSEQEITEANQALKSMNPARAKLVLAGLNSSYVQANGKEPKLVEGAAAHVTTGLQAFRSTDEIYRAMKDPRYKTDPAYRDDVAQRLARSTVI